MQHRRRLTAFALLTAGAVALTGCTGGGGGGDAEESAELDTLSLMVPYLVTNAPSDDNEIHDALEEIAGVDLDITWVPNSSYGDKTNITLAGDDIPHVMVIQGKDPGFVRNAEAGAFWDLTEYLGDYPNLTTTFPEVQQAASVNGRSYGIFRARDVMRAAVIVRKDWLTNLGLELPETTDDLYEVAKAFSEQDPDGNGVDDTYGIIVPKWPGAIGTSSPYDVIETWHGAGNRWTERDGELVPNFTTDEWLEAVDYEKRLV
ncbi:extracellular solute-binding protein, partial [Microbacterium sp. zg.Y909]|uniref:extracellular solute-binding protein n=1 Tax=Microbacterium sp. zg.Y909 TaxID=2969413 RepID=UPI00214A8FBF